MVYSNRDNNAFYAQSGGVTPVINASAAGVIMAARQKGIKVYAGADGIIGALHEQLIDTTKMSEQEVAALRYTPAGAFGSCRFKLTDMQKQAKEYRRLIEVFKAHKIRYFLYNGGGDSQDTAHKVSQIAQEMAYPLVCVGIPKTIDNDLYATDFSPGFPSVAKYVAISSMEATLDLASMCSSSTKVFILEVMGRHTGWIAAAAGLTPVGFGAQIILFPEVAFNQEHFLARVKECVKNYGYCSIVVSEGVRDTSGQFLSASGNKDAFGHQQLGGVAPYIARLIQEKLKLKHHWAVSDYLQRSARHIASKVDVEQAYALGKFALKVALKGINGKMVTLERSKKNNKIIWETGLAELAQVANQEKHLPADYIAANGFEITEKAKKYLLPLIQGEAYPPYHQGLPAYFRLNAKFLKKKCTDFV
jgi:6-phosphofructokinase 1